MFVGIDLGTSGVKAVLTTEGGDLVGQATAPLAVSSPRPQWSEQDPAAWWSATLAAMAGLRAAHDLSGVRGLGLAGQMHGAVLLDEAGAVLRPAILWNDGRSGAECHALEAAEPRSRAITGNLAMPGFTAPKLLWLRTHEPDLFARTRRVLLPKDWLRLRMTGEAVSEMSDASGTLWLDVAGRRWSPAMLGATGLSEAQMPRLAEGTEVAGMLHPQAAQALGLPAGIPVAGGAGDNAGGAAGIGCIRPGDAFVSLGTSGVIFVSDGGFLPDPARTVHAFCHCIPGTWHRMSVILSAGAALAWLARALGSTEAALLAEAEAAPPSDSRVAFLPYLAGERTPHNDPAASGVFFGLGTGTSRADLTRAVLEGVAFALADGLDTLEAKGGPIPVLTAIGGGARSASWLRILAAALQRPLQAVGGGEVGPALGAARLAAIACGGTVDDVCTKPAPARLFPPDTALVEALRPKRAVYRRLYPALNAVFADVGATS